MFYRPVDFTHPDVIANDRSVKLCGWADPAQWSEELHADIATRVSMSGPIVFGENGKPVNPNGRTGMCGRGSLGKYGPNHVADPVLTRHSPATGAVQVLVIQRPDNPRPRLPSGMVNSGEAVSLTLRRELTETLAYLEEREADIMMARLGHLFARGGRVVYRGYVDDWRATDEAWIETTCVHFHIDDAELAQKLAPARWIDTNMSNPGYAMMYSNHRMLVDAALVGWAE